MERKSIFKKPFGNKSSTASTSKNEDIFSRSNRSYISVAEQEEKRALKRAEKAAKRQQERVEEVDRGGPTDKKRRISISESDDDDGEESESTKDTNFKVRRTSSTQTPTKRLSRLSNSQTPGKSPTAGENQPKYKLEIVELVHDSSDELEEVIQPPRTSSELDDDLQITAVTSQPLKPPDFEDYERSESDDEFAELARQAREMAKKRRMQQHSVLPNLSDRLAQEGSTNGTITAMTQAPPPKAPIAEILITSKIPGTDVKVIKRRIDQRLKEVRLAWCSCQEFSDLESQRIVLLFKKSRVFDVDTPRSIGIGVDAFGDIVMEGEQDSLGSADRRIHMEAIYEEDLQNLAMEQEQARDPELDDAELEPPPPEPQEPQIKIILRARGMENFKLIVKPVRLSFLLKRCPSKAR